MRATRSTPDDVMTYTWSPTQNECNIRCRNEIINKCRRTDLEPAGVGLELLKEATSGKSKVTGRIDKLLHLLSLLVEHARRDVERV